MNFKKILMMMMVIITISSTVNAASFNLPTSWILKNDGTSIDTNNNGYPDYADNVLNATFAGTAQDALKLGGELPDYYLDYDNMNAGTVGDSYIDSASTWNAKGGTGVCSAGFVVKEVTTTGVLCTPASDITENQVKDFAWNVLTGEQDGITVEYNDTTKEVSFRVDDIGLIGLSDVGVSDVQDGDILVYDADASEWQNKVVNVIYYAGNGIELDGTTFNLNTTYTDGRYVQSETDPVWTAEKTDYYTKAQADGEFLKTYTETDPVWLSEKTDYYTKAQADTEFLKTYSETDPVWTSEKTNYLTETASDAKYLQSFTETDPVWTADKTDYLTETASDAKYLQSFTETDPVWTADKTDYYTKTEVDAKGSFSSAGMKEAPGYTDNGAGSLTITSGTANLFDNAEYQGFVSQYAISSDTFTLTNNAANYVVVNYNSGSPIYQVTQDVTIITESDVVPVYTVYRHDGDLHILDWDGLGQGLPNKIHQRIVKTARFAREYGLLLDASTNDGYFTISSGAVWYGANRVELNSFASTTGYNLYTKTAGVWSSTTQTQFNNNIYQDGDNTATLLNNRYAVTWVYRDIDNDEDVFAVLGTTNLGLDDTLDAQPPSDIPDIIKSNALLLGRIVVIQGGSTPTNVDSAFIIPFTGAGTTEHNNLINIQGGAANEYYHLTSAQFGNVEDWSNNDWSSVSITESQISDFGTYLTTETDPVWTAEKGDYYIKTEVDALPVSTFTNDAGYLTSYSETDPVWVGDKVNYYTKTETGNLVVSTFTNDAGYLTSYSETDPVWLAQKADYFTKLEADNRYLQSYTETDPVWSSEKSGYYTKTEADNAFLDETGGSLSGDLNMTNNDITDVQSITFDNGAQIQLDTNGICLVSPNGLSKTCAYD